MAVVVTDKDWVEALDLVVGALDELPLPEVQARCLLARSKFEAVEVRRLAAEVRADGDDRQARKMAGRGGRSKSSARRAAARAKAVSKNPGLADDLAAGELSDEKLDSIADAMRGDDPDSDESAATDGEFIDAIKKRSVDQGRKLAQQRKNQSRGGESEYDKQRRLRNARRWKDSLTGLSMVQFGGDDASIEEFWNLVMAEEKRLKEADGGRDLSSSKHPRTFDQRLFDAGMNLIRGTGAGNGLGKAPHKASGAKATGAKPSIVVAVGVDASGVAGARVVGGGPLPDSALRELLARADISLELVDLFTGQPLWHARLKRTATAAQFLAMVVRDEGCGLCDAHWTRCEAHHMTPWHAPAKGKTDIDDMALLCTSCHHQLHADLMTLERLDDGTYKSRPATPDEIPPQHRPSCSTGNRVHNSPGRSQHRDSGAPMDHRRQSSNVAAPTARNPARCPLSAAQVNPALLPQPGTRQSGGADDGASS